MVFVHCMVSVFLESTLLFCFVLIAVILLCQKAGIF